jgi:hypothetical protein
LARRFAEANDVGKEVVNSILAAMLALSNVAKKSPASDSEISETTA